METKNSEILYDRSKKSIPGGVNSPVRAFKSVDREYPIFIKKAKGSKLYDEDNNEFIDCIGSWGPMILGHNHDKVLEAVKKEIENGTSFGLPTKKEIELAEMIKECFPSIDKVRLTASGTEAAMAAVRLARAFTKKNKILKFEGCYHGHSDSLMVKAGSGLLTFGHQDSNGITEGTMKDTLTLPFGDVEKIKKLINDEKDIACIIVEPVPANMGLIIPEKDFLKFLRDICDENNILLIFDEVISGFRVALGGAQELYNISADLTILGKIIGGGYPVGAFGGKEEIMNMVAPVGNVYHAGTLSGNPVSVTAGLETIGTIRKTENFYKNLEERVSGLVVKIQDLINKYNIPATINHTGSLYTIFFSDKKVNNLEDAMITSDEMYNIYFSIMLDEGIIIPPSKYEAHFISYSHNEKDFEKILTGVEKAFSKISLGE